MTWNWDQPDWPRFVWNNSNLAEMKAQFLRQSGILFGATKHFTDRDKDLIVVDHITGEALKTSEIEGEYLNQDSVQSSIRRNLGLATDNRRVQPAERGIADMMTDLYKSFHRPLTHSTLFDWHKMLSNGRQDLKEIGCYRTHDDPMQVVSARLVKPIVHFEAPPSKRITQEMDAFLEWWADTAPGGVTAYRHSHELVLRISILSVSTLLKMEMAALAAPWQKNPLPRI
jgi:Fic family protein